LQRVDITYTKWKLLLQLTRLPLFNELLTYA